MKDIASYFITPRKCEPVTTANSRSPSSKSKLPNDSCEKACEKRKLESGSDEDVAKLKRRSLTSPEITPQLGGNLTVVLKPIDVYLPKNESPTKNAFKKVLSKQTPKTDESIDVSETKSTKKRQKKRKRIRVPEPGSSDDEKSDSSAKLFKENKKPTKAAAAATNRRSDANNLFKYFSKAEKKPMSVEDNDSPVKCHRVVQVKAIIHSPPKARRSISDDFEYEVQLSKTSDSNIDDIRSPVVKIVRTDSPQYKALDEIIEIDSDFMDTSSVRKCKPKITSTTDESESSSDNFTAPKIQPWKMRVQFVSGNRLMKRHKKSESKDKKPRDASGSVTEKSLISEASSKGAAKAVASETATYGVEQEVTADTTDAAKEIISEAATDKAAKQISSETGSEGAVKKKVTAADFVKKKLIVSLTRFELKTPVKVDTNFEIVSSDAGFEEDKPIIKKLAPLFCKAPAQKKVLPKPVDMEARRQFLESGVPENIKKKMEEQKKAEAEEIIHREYRFPEHTHVQQVEPSHWVWNLKEVTSFNVKPTGDKVVIPQFQSIVELVSRRKPVEASLSNEKLNVAEEIAALKKQEPDVNVGDVFTSVKKLSKDVGPESKTLCWTEKYKPTTYSDVIGNSTNLLKLKEWIESHKRIKFRISDSDGDSSDDFVDSDDSSCSVETRNNVALLAGPPGCGKTCAVYTLANELGFKVIEVNAASNRNGKRILDELQEATQSHRVKRSTIFDKDTKKSKKKKKVPKEERKTMSLILIEDADILFENYDDGFLPALSSLTLHSKRPFIFTVNNLNHPHLAKYTKNQTLVLTFAYPTVSLLNVWLRSIALNEGVRLSDEVIMYLFHVAGLDLRKSLLQLQMLISSNKCLSTLDNEQLFYTDWWKRIPKRSRNKSFRQLTDKLTTSPVKLFSDDEDEEPVTKKSKDQCEETQLDTKTESDPEANVKSLNRIASLFERIAILGNFESANSNQCVAVPGEDTAEQSSNSCGSQLGHDIVDTIKTQIFSDTCNTDSSFSFREYYRKIRVSKDIKQIVDNVFCNFNPMPSNTESKYCDYLSAIRDIARIESCKASGQRRNSRYFSYLNSINIHVSEKESNFLSNSLL